MGKLIDILDFKEQRVPPRNGGDGFESKRLDPSWYFPTRDVDIGRMYPACISIHREDLVVENRFQSSTRERNGLRRIEIRKFVERELVGDVIWEYVSSNYWRVNQKMEVDGDFIHFEIVHGYYRFHFEEISEGIHFKLRFSDFTREVMQRHPDYPEQSSMLDFFGETAQRDALRAARKF